MKNRDKMRYLRAHNVHPTVGRPNAVKKHNQAYQRFLTIRSELERVSTGWSRGRHKRRRQEELSGQNHKQIPMSVLLCVRVGEGGAPSLLESGWNRIRRRKRQKTEEMG